MLKTIPQLQTQMDLYLTAPSTSEIAIKLEALADEWMTHNREKKAIVCLTKSVTIYEELSGFTLELARTSLKLGHIYRKLGNHKETGASYKQALAAYKVAYPTPHLELAGMVYTLGSFMEQLMKLIPAETYYQEALSIIETVEGKQHPQCNVIRDRIESLQSKRNLYKK